MISVVAIVFLLGENEQNPDDLQCDGCLGLLCCMILSGAPRQRKSPFYYPSLIHLTSRVLFAYYCKAYDEAHSTDLRKRPCAF